MDHCYIISVDDSALMVFFFHIHAISDGKLLRKTLTHKAAYHAQTELNKLKSQMNHLKCDYESFVK